MALPYVFSFSETDATMLVGGCFADSPNGTVTFINAGGTNDAQTYLGTAYGYSSGGKCLVNAGSADVIVSEKVIIGSSQYNILLLRSTSNASVHLQAWFQSGNIRIYDEALNPIAGPIATTIANNDIVSAECSGSSIILKVNGVPVLTTTSSHGLSNTYFGLYVQGGERYDDFTIAAFAVATPTVTLTKATPTTVYLAGTAGTGGTTPVWKRSTAADGTYTTLSNGSGISGVGTYSLVDASSGIVAGTRYYYKLDDSSGTSNIQSAGKWKTPAYVLFIGDSITIGTGVDAPSVHFATAVRKAANGQRDYITLNVAEGGLKASDWYNTDFDGITGTAQSGSTSSTIKLATGASAADDFYNNYKVSIISGTGSGQSRFVFSYVGSTRVATISGSNWSVTPDNTSVYLFSGEVKRLADGITAGVAAGCTHAMITLGVNNAYSGETVSKFALDMAAIATTCIAGGLVTILNYPTGIPATEAAPTTKLLQLAAAIDPLCNGTTVLLGDTLMLQYLPDHATTELQESGLGVHPNAVGTVSVGDAWAWAWARAVGDAPPPSTPAPRVLQCVGTY